MAFERSDGFDGPAAVHAFTDHLESDSYQGFRFGRYRDSKPGLLDCIQHWLEHGDALDVCPTYDLYLLQIIELIQNWEYNKHTVYSNDTPLWPDAPGSRTGPKLAIVEFDWAGLPEGWTEETNAWLYLHPAVSRELFESVRETRLTTRP